MRGRGMVEADVERFGDGYLEVLPALVSVAPFLTASPSPPVFSAPVVSVESGSSIPVMAVTKHDNADKM